MQRGTSVKETRKRKGIRYERVKEGGEGRVSEDPAWVVGDASDDDDESEEEPTPYINEASGKGGGLEEEVDVVVGHAEEVEEGRRVNGAVHGARGCERIQLFHGAVLIHSKIFMPSIPTCLFIVT